ncbi:hypothetical protein MKX01_021985 [Papaver californicum]|nr:hypothetical protein MKX01_021985 [Papaver californicum]
MRSILSHGSLESSLANQLTMKLSNSNLQTSILYEIFLDIKERDPACISYVHYILNFKGFLAIQTHRITQKLWSQDRKTLAFLIQNRVSELFGVDIHPAAKIGHGILLDHATGVVSGETSVIGNNVSIIHNVTLGGTGNVCGDRHPKIEDGVLIGACCSILGNVRIGEGAKIGAGSFVVKDVAARTTSVGNPARLLGEIELHKSFKNSKLKRSYASCEHTTTNAYFSQCKEMSTKSWKCQLHHQQQFGTMTQE